MASTTLWDLASYPLHFTSYNSRCGNDKSVTAPGLRILELPSDWMADRCVHDPNLLNALEDSVQAAFTPVLATQALVDDWLSIRRFYEKEVGVMLSSETRVKGFLIRSWIALAERVLSHFVKEKQLGLEFCFVETDSTQHQQPDIRAQLITEDGTIDVGLIEFQSEGIVRMFWEEVVGRGMRNVKVDWEGMGGWDTVDKIVVKVASYLAQFKLSWLCWGAASHLLVFRLVRNSVQAPYLVVSGVAHVNDTKDPLQNLADARIGERWLPAIIGCALAGMAETDDLQFDFDVQNVAVVSGSPTLTPREIEQQSAGSSSSSEISQTSSDDSWTTGPSGRTHIDAFLTFSSVSGPRSLAAPLIACSPSGNDFGHQNLLRDDGNEELPSGLWEKRNIVSSFIPELEAGIMLGEGSTGDVYEGVWKNKKVAVKMAEGIEERNRLERECGWYGWLSQQGTKKVALPTFLGWYRHSSFDLLVMSHEGDPVASWDNLRQNERYDLFSIVCELHQAGLRHGDIEPRNVLRSKTGKVCLIDLSEASEHSCRVMVSGRIFTEMVLTPPAKRKKYVSFSDERLFLNVRSCDELESLCIALDIRQNPRHK